MSAIANKYWLPLGNTPEQMQKEWNISQGDLNEISSGLKEIEAYEDFHREAPKEDPEQDFEAIRKARKESQ